MRVLARVGVGLESFYAPGFACGEVEKNTYSHFSSEVSKGISQEPLLASVVFNLFKIEEVIFSDDTATEVRANEVGYVVSEERLQQDQVIQ